MRADELMLRKLSGQADEMAELQSVFEQAPTYFERIMGGSPGPSEAQSVYTVLPEGRNYSHKLVLGIFSADEVIGCVDVIRGYPTLNEAFIGLLLIAEQHQNKGVGRVAMAEVERLIKSEWPEVRTLRIGIVGFNENVLPFWVKVGFYRTGEVKPYQCYGQETIVIMMEKLIEETVKPRTGFE